MWSSHPNSGLFEALNRAKTVPESDGFMRLELALSEKQIPQITENTEKSK